MNEPLRLAQVPESSTDGEPAEVEAFEVFFEAEKARLYSALCLVTRDRHEAEELTQDAFVRVLASWHRVSIADPTAYLYRTAMNAFRSRRRRRHPDPRDRPPHPSGRRPRDRARRPLVSRR